jgi:polysaccharide export outer membrane protein
VFRAREPGKITVFQLETSSPTGMLIGTRFVLEPLDVVYAVRSPLQKWNDAISGLLPSVQAVTAVDSFNN